MVMLQTRRAFLATAAGAGLWLAAGCRRNPGTQSSAKGDSVAGPGMSVLHHGNVAEPSTLDPHLAQGTWEDNIIGDMLMGLTTESAAGEPLPGAAESWEASKDGLTWTFRLRDHQWSDGRPVKASDFVYAWRRILNPRTAASYAYYLYLIRNAQDVNAGRLPETALGIIAQDERTLLITLEHPAPYLPQYLTHYTTFPVPEHVVAEKGDAWTKPGNYVVNGAFALLEWSPNDHVTLQRNPKFWDAGNVALDRIVYYPTADYSAALKRFRGGELDIQDRMPSEEIDWIRANIPDSMRLGPILATDCVVANETRKPFDDPRVREALSLAIDRETLTDKIRKLGETPAYNIVPPGTANYPGGVVADFKSLPYPERLKRAQQLMQQAGYGPGRRLKTTFLIRSVSLDRMREPAAIQAMWRPVFVDAEIMQSDTAIFYARIQQGDFDLSQPGWQADFNDATTFLDLFRTGNINNWSHFSDSHYDALLDAAAQELDLEERGKLLAEAEAIVVKANAWMPIFFWQSQALVRPYVHGWQVNPRDNHRSRWIAIDAAARAAALR